MSEKGLKTVEIALDAAPSLGVLRFPVESVYEVCKPEESFRVEQIDGRTYIRFATTGAFGSLLLDADSGMVFEIHDEDSGVNFVNETMGKFTRCLEFFSSLLVGQAEDDDELADELEAGIREIDPRAYEENSFWYEVRWGVALGDFS
ncbi:SUKH-4 family immunity protein [Streptomyces sp. NPDC015684]|uniref:SUKH-4 family immunity protein n=1 Tax=Streptomyces sp. NPDC015684 TaxID=3364963 RepID=UPI0036F7C85B